MSDLQLYLYDLPEFSTVRLNKTIDMSNLADTAMMSLNQ